MPTVANPPLVLFLTVVTVAAYAIARRLYLRSGQQPFFQPVLVATLLLIPILLVLGQTADDYLPVEKLLTWPLGPATAALAVPVYLHRRQVRSALLPLVVGVVSGSLATILTILCVAVAFGLTTSVLDSLAAKSVTAAIAVELSRMQGGDVSLTAAVVVLTGSIGAMLGPSCLSWARVRLPIARGIALGTISMTMGTATALQEHESSGAVAAAALVGAAVVTALMLPVVLPVSLRLLGR